MRTLDMRAHYDFYLGGEWLAAIDAAPMMSQLPAAMINGLTWTRGPVRASAGCCSTSVPSTSGFGGSGFVSPVIVVVVVDVVVLDPSTSPHVSVSPNLASRRRSP